MFRVRHADDPPLSGGRKMSKIFVVDSQGATGREIVLEDMEDLRVGSIDWTMAELVEI